MSDLKQRKAATAESSSTKASNDTLKKSISQRQKKSAQNGAIPLFVLIKVLIFTVLMGVVPLTTYFALNRYIRMS
jgi:hypothetical protein